MMKMNSLGLSNTVAARHRHKTVVVTCLEHVKSRQIGAIRGADSH